MELMSTPTILVVDDDRTSRTILAELLGHDYRVLLAKDGTAALTTLENEAVDLVLLDISMPGISGYDVLRSIRASEQHSQLGVILVTGMDDQKAEETGLLLGASDFIQKPYRPAVVLTRVKHHIELAKQRRARA